MLPNTSDLNPSQSVRSKASNKPFVCTANSDWVGTGFLKDSCDAALSRMYVTEVARYQGRMMEFAAPDVFPPMPPPSMPTPRNFTVGECNAYAINETLHLQITERKGSCVLAVVMLSDFGPENLPSERGLDSPLGSDQTGWNDIYSAASDLISRCVGRRRTPGWTVVGAQDNLHLIVSGQYVTDYVTANS